jgi:glycosyltransferase involved in cell wall biosynthesis
MLGQHPGWVVTQGEILADLFAGEGYTVRRTSAVLGRAGRLADMLRSLIAWRREIDLVIHQVFSGPAFAVADVTTLLVRRLRLPQVLTLRGGDLPHFTGRYPQWGRRVLRRSGAIVAPSSYLVHEMGVLLGALQATAGIGTEVIPNVLRIERYPYQMRRVLRPRLLWMRTFHDVYHPEMAVGVLEALHRSHPEATLTMGGQDKGLLPAVQELVVAKGLAPYVSFAGFLDTRAKVEQFTTHDIYLHTNRVDNMPVSVVEAAAFGLPVVATRVGGIPYLLAHEETALLVPDGDITAMSHAVRRLLAEPDLAACLSENGRRLAESCAWPQVRARWETLFAGLQGRW